MDVWNGTFIGDLKEMLEEILKKSKHDPRRELDMSGNEFSRRF